MTDAGAALAAAERIAERVLLPAAATVDTTGSIPRRHLDVLADEGFCALFGPDEYGGLGAGDLTAGTASWRRSRADVWRRRLCGSSTRASELAMRAAMTLLVSVGARAVLLHEHAQRLLREAAFLLVFGSRPAIHAALLRRFRRASPEPDLAG